MRLDGGGLKNKWSGGCLRFDPGKEDRGGQESDRSRACSLFWALMLVFRAKPGVLIVPGRGGRGINQRIERRQRVAKSGPGPAELIPDFKTIVTL